MLEKYFYHWLITYLVTTFFLLNPNSAQSSTSIAANTKDQSDEDEVSSEKLIDKETLPSLTLQVGQRYPIEGLLVENIEITPTSIVSVHQTPQGTLLIALRPGTALLKAKAGEKQIQIKIIVHEGVPSSHQVTSSQQLLSELKSLPGIKTSVLGNKIILQGEVLGRHAFQKILLILKELSKNIIVLATAGPGIKASLIEQANNLLQSKQLPNVQITNAGNRFFLEGSVSSPEDIERALEMVQIIIPNIENHLPIPIRVDPTISIRLYLLELSRQAHEELGLSWPTNINQALVFNPTFTSFNPTWTASLNHLTTQGLAKILAEPMISVKNGAQAELSAGGEIPLKITGIFENKVTWRSYGLKIKLHIAGVAGKHIRTQIDSEASQLDEATTQDNIPGIKTTKISTEIDALEGQPILLTGLFQAGVAKDINKVPLIGSIPILGELFKSRRFRENESELLVAILPSFGAQTIALPLQSARGLDFDSSWRPLD